MYLATPRFMFEQALDDLVKEPRPSPARGRAPIGFHRLIQRIEEAAKMPFPIHPHMLRHACGFKLANDGHDTRALQHYLGHKNIQHTVRYTEMAPDRFKEFWRN
jgi:site-specific recombinase XerD